MKLEEEGDSWNMFSHSCTCVNAVMLGGVSGWDLEWLNKGQASCQKWLCSHFWVLIYIKVEVGVGPMRSLI